MSGNALTASGAEHAWPVRVQQHMITRNAPQALIEGAKDLVSFYDGNAQFGHDRGVQLGEVLHYVQYSPESMVERVRQQAERAFRSGQITLSQMRLLMRHYEESLGKYTYLSDDDE
ncbi:hypothetical protein EON62_02740 [archaeon]|nr:MAG: hypothetical protein EON62_02740 [archaeon]